MTDAQARIVIADTIQAHRKMLDDVAERNVDAILAAAKAVTDVLLKGRTIYLCGNGGSAADAQHIAGELVGRFIRERRAFPAVALSADTSVLTCLANDYSYDQVFARQVEALVRKGDLLWAFSTSGSSANVVAAAKLARTKGAIVLAFTGRADSPLEQLANLCFCAEHKLTARSQEIHQLAYHIICDLVEQNISEQSTP
jgi:D-sedoheptulose 7-phosphate isomerase